MSASGPASIPTNPTTLKAVPRLGGKGTPRRKVYKKPTTTGLNEERKLATVTKKLGVQTIPGIEEVNLFQADGNIIHFSAPLLRASVPCNTFIVSGNGECKEITELVPGILDQLGPLSISSLKKIADAYGSSTGSAKPSSLATGNHEKEEEEGSEEQQADRKQFITNDEEDDDQIPELVESFESKINE